MSVIKINFDGVRYVGSTPLPFSFKEEGITIREEILKNWYEYVPSGLLGLPDHKIEAIKRLRALTYCGLKEAKDFVDKFVPGKAFVDHGEAHLLADLFPIYLNLYRASNVPENVKKDIEATYPEIGTVVEQMSAAQRIATETPRRDLIAAFKKGLNLAIDIYAELGFDTPFRAVDVISENFKNKWDDLQ